MKLETYCTLSTAAIAIHLFVVPQAKAQDTAANPATQANENAGLEEIIVTAQRRSENLQRVPIAVSALDTIALTNAGVTNAQQLAQVTPSMVINNTGTQLATFIRGVGTRLAAPGLEPSVATYVDDRYEGQAGATLVQLLDVQRVEVVKGPQGVLFGRNATGGAVRIITNDPVDHLEGNVRASYGNYDAKELRGTINLPVTSTLSTRFSALYVKRDGDVRNINPNAGPRKLNSVNNVVLRGKLLWNMSPSVTAKLGVEYSRQRDSAGSAFVPLPPFDLNPLLVAGALGGMRPGEAATALDVLNRQHEISSQLRLDADLDAVKLSSITTYGRPIAHLASDVDATTAVSTDTYDYHIRRNTWTQELQAVSNGAGSFHWLVGGFFFDEKALVEALVFVPVRISTGGQQRVNTRSVAAFGQLTYDLTQKLSITLGGRYGHEKKNLNVTPSIGVINLTALAPFSAKTSFSKFAPRAVIQWQYSPEGMVYASYSRGIKGGGYSFPASGQPILRPEVLDSFEVGWKANLLDNRVRISSAAFYYDYKDLQVSRSATLPNGGFAILTDNAATSTVKGIEADLKIKPASNFTLSGGATYLEAKYDKFPGTARIFRIDTAMPGNGLGTVSIPFNAAGRQLLYTPKFAGYVSGEFGADLGSGRMSASVTLSYKSSYEIDFVSTPRLSVMRQKAYTQLAARVGYDVTGTGLSVALFGSNLTNKRYLADASVNSAGPKGIYSDPRTYGIQIGYSF